MTKSRLVMFLLATMSLVCVADAREIVDEQNGFSITIPDSFQDFPAGKTRPSILYSFVRYMPDGSGTSTFSFNA